MKVLVSTLNAKYIHTSLALRLLYIANKERFNISFHEFTIKEDLQNVIGQILSYKPKVIGLGVYIWNVKQTKQLVDLLKQMQPELTIILGGPEVMYDPDFFLQTWNVDYIVSGEGEFVLGELLEAIESSLDVDIEGVSTKDKINEKIVQADLNKVSLLPSPYQLEEDKAEMKNKLVYFETSRGCPYQCQYCLSSLEKGVRYFPVQYINNNLGYLLSNGAKQIKFLDRTFNLNREHTLRIFDFLLQEYKPGISCQFEIYADLLDDDLINYLNEKLPQNYFRFEIGIQSTYELTNMAIKRKQNFELLSANISKLMDGGKIDLHLDLIAGLPYESFDRFVKSFNDVFELGGKELQLGFLKMLRGTNLRRDASNFGYVYDEDSPYQVISNDDISKEELERISGVEHALEKYWNSGRFSRTMGVLFNSYFKGHYFQFFELIAQHYKENNLPERGYQLEDIFGHLHKLLSGLGIDLLPLLRKDYYFNFSQRPYGFWDETIDKKTRKALLYKIGQDKEFLRKHNLSRNLIEKHSAIDKLSENTYQLTVFIQEEDGCVRKEMKYEVN